MKDQYSCDVNDFCEYGLLRARVSVIFDAHDRTALAYPFRALR